MHLVEASEADKRARDALTFMAWGQALTQAQFLEREQVLRAHPFAAATMTTWLWRAGDGRVLSSCETFRLDARRGGSAGVAFMVATVFTEPALRGQGHAVAMLEALSVRLAGPTTLALTLFSEVGAKVYERCGFVAQPAFDVVWPVDGQRLARAADCEAAQGSLRAAHSTGALERTGSGAARGVPQEPAHSTSALEARASGARGVLQDAAHSTGAVEGRASGASRGFIQDAAHSTGALEGRASGAAHGVFQEAAHAAGALEGSSDVAHGAIQDPHATGALDPVRWTEGPSAPRSAPHADDALRLVTSEAQSAWHLERERFYARALGKPAAAGHLATLGSSRLAVAAAFQADELHVLWYEFAAGAHVAPLLSACERLAFQLGLARVRVWETTPFPLPPFATRSARTDELPMVRPLDGGPARWADITRTVWA